MRWIAAKTIATSRQWTYFADRTRRKQKASEASIELTCIAKHRQQWQALAAPCQATYDCPLRSWASRRAKSADHLSNAFFAYVHCENESM